MLSPRNAQNQVEQALLLQLVLGLQQRQVVPNVAALRALPARVRFVGGGAGGAGGSPFRSELEIIFVTSRHCCYLWSAASVAPDNGQSAVCPSDTPNYMTGRWLQAQSTARLDSTLLHEIESGPLAAVLLAYGDVSPEDVDELLAGRRPAVVALPRGDEVSSRTSQSGALYEFRTEFELLTLSSNLRGGGLAVRGSPVAQEDPGANYLDGITCELLAGSNLGLATDVVLCEVGAGRILRADARQQRVTRSRRLTVVADVGSTANDHDLVEIESLRVQRLLHDGSPIGDPFQVPRP